MSLSSKTCYRESANTITLTFNKTIIWLIYECNMMTELSFQCTVSSRTFCALFSYSSHSHNQWKTRTGHLGVLKLKEQDEPWKGQDDQFKNGNQNNEGSFLTSHHPSFIRLLAVCVRESEREKRRLFISQGRLKQQLMTKRWMWQHQYMLEIKMSSNCQPMANTSTKAVVHNWFD